MGCRARDRSTLSIVRRLAGRMAFVPEGQHDSSQARSACPGGAEEFSPGFQPWETSNKAVRPERAGDGVGEMPFECYRKGIGHFLGRRYNLPLANNTHRHKVERWRAL